MIGTFINVAAILVGGSLGLLFGSRLPERLKTTVIAGMGLFTAVTGIKMFLETQNSLVVLGSLVIGALLGEWWKIEDGLQRLGEMLEKRFNRSDGENGMVKPYGDFVRGFMIASLLFCIGPIAILGSIQAGLTGDYNLLVIKSVLGWVCVDGICIHAGGGGAIFSCHDPDIPGSHHTAGCPIECDCKQADDGRNDRHRRGAPARHRHQQPVGNKKNPRGKFPARPGYRPADRVDRQPVLIDK